MKNRLVVPGVLLMTLALFSCGSSRNAQYLQGAFDTARISKLNIPEPVIQKGDLLSIIVYSDNPQATAIYNQPIIPPTTNQGASSLSVTPPQGYLVDLDGNIQFQGLGTLHIEGMTRKALNDTLLERLKVYLIHPYTNIRYLNYKITVMGEVAKPGVYTIPSERINVLEAIGLAGEVTAYGRKENVLVIREVNGKREFGRLDLRSPEIFSSPYYYLQQNDIVLLDQDKNKQSATDQVTARNIGLGASVISTIAILISVLRR